MEETLKEKIERSDALVLCKNELFLQKIGGETIDSLYPCNAEIAKLLGEVFGKEVQFE